MNTSRLLRRHTLATAALIALSPPAFAVNYVFSSGTFVSGVTTPQPLAAGDVLNINAGGNKFFSGAGSNFTNGGGNVNWNVDALFLQSGVAIINNALWNATSDDSLVYNGGAAPSFTNNGTFRKSAGAGSTTINSGVGFVNNGTLDAQTGSIAFVGGSTFNAGTQFTGAGVVNVTSGTNVFNGAFTSSNLRLSGGTHLGNGAVVGGTVAFSGGTLSGSWGIGAGQTLTGVDGGFKFIDGAATVLTNLGMIDWNTTDPLYMQSGGSLRNQALFVANQNTSIVYNGGAAPSFDNTASGTVRAAAGKTLTIGSGAGFVNNGGTLDAQAGGAIVYNGGTVFNAGTQFTGAGSNLAAGNNTFNGSFNSANLVLQSGIHTGNAAVVSGSSTAFTGGTLSGGWTVAAGQTLQAQGGGFKFIDGAATVLTNKGTVNWNTTDLLYLRSGATLLNQGTINYSADGGVVYNGGAGPTFINSGLIVKSGGAGTTTIGDTLAFNNLGMIDVQTGTLALPTNFTNNGTLKGSGTFSVSGTLTNAGTVAPGASPGALGLSGNFAQAAGGSFAVELQSLASHDLFNVSGRAALGGALSISCFANCSFALGDTVTILDSVGDLSGTFASVALSGFATGAFNVIYDTVGDRVLLQVTQAVTAVPEGETWALMLAGLGVLGWVARRQRV